MSPRIRSRVELSLLAPVLLIWGLGFAVTSGSPTFAQEAQPVALDRPLRVGLATDLEAFSMGCCAAGIEVLVGDRRLDVDGSIQVFPAATAEDSVYRLQVAALEDDLLAGRLAASLRVATGAPTTSSFDSGIGLYRVRVGRFSEREEAEGFRTRFADHGLGDSWVVVEGGLSSEPALLLRTSAGDQQIAGRWLTITGPVDLPFGEDRYRGQIRLYLNDRGRLNVINVLELEDYLLGVVPLEMGPDLYPELESLKAQAVAARTYALRNLGGFEGEGYDLCATPRCQVYGGRKVEHPLSNRAVAESRSEVLVNGGALAETLYSASCGGITEDVHVVFPAKSEPYLRSVRCVEGERSRLGGGDRQPLTRGVVDALLGAPVHGNDRERVEFRLDRLAQLAGQPQPGPLATTRVQDLRDYLQTSFPGAIGGSLLPADDGSARSATERSLAALLEGPPDSQLSVEQVDELIFWMARLLDVVRVHRAYFQHSLGDRMEVRDGGGVHLLELPKDLRTFGLSQGVLVASAVNLAPGDRLLLFWHGDRWLALAQEISAPEAGRQVGSWTHTRSLSQLRAMVAVRHSGFTLTDLSLVAHGASGRVAKIRLTGEGGESFEVVGLAVRWTLDLPDTLFSMEKRGSGSAASWVFRGRGLGHGVGLCQRGAFAMAQRGLTYREILTHYYSGVELMRLRGGTDG